MNSKLRMSDSKISTALLASAVLSSTQPSCKPKYEQAKSCLREDFTLDTVLHNEPEIDAVMQCVDRGMQAWFDMNNFIISDGERELVAEDFKKNVFLCIPQEKIVNSDCYGKYDIPDTERADITRAAFIEALAFKIHTGCSPKLSYANQCAEPYFVHGITSEQTCSIYSEVGACVTIDEPQFCGGMTYIDMPDELTENQPSDAKYVDELDFSTRFGVACNGVRVRNRAFQNILNSCSSNTSFTDFGSLWSNLEPCYTK